VQIFRPANRDGLQDHPWVTQQGSDKLLSEEENSSDLVEPPTAAEMNAAITNNIGNLMTVVSIRAFDSIEAIE
jgi:hypothetical protein